MKVLSMPCIPCDLHCTHAHVTLYPPHPPYLTEGIACSSRLRASGQSPLSMRTPVKAVNPVGSMTTSRQPTRGLPVIQTPALQSPGPANGGGGGGGCYVPGRASAGAGRLVASRGQTVPATRSKLLQPGRRRVLFYVLYVRIVSSFRDYM